MSSYTPRISVIIPTYNRGYFLKETLHTCISQHYPNCEFIVQDDCSLDGTFDIIKSEIDSDRRIRYVNIGKNVGMRENFENALNAVRGDYVICLGGDDGLMPGALDRLADIISRHPDTVITWPTPSFFYPGAGSAYGQLVAPHAIFRTQKELKLCGRSFLEKQAELKFYVSDPEAPMLYVKSIIPYKLIKNIKQKSGNRFFVSSTPDGYSAFAIAANVSNYLFTNTPFTLHGVSPNSAGLNYVQEADPSSNLSGKFFNDVGAVPCAKELGSVPYSPLISLMTSDFLFTSDKLFKHGVSRNISIPGMISAALDELCDGLMSEGKIQRELSIIRSIAEYNRQVPYFNSEVSKKRLNLRRKLIGDAISARLIYKDPRRANVKNIQEASVFFQDRIHTKKIYTEINWPLAIVNSLQYRLRSFIKSRRLNEYM